MSGSGREQLRNAIRDATFRRSMLDLAEKNSMDAFSFAEIVKMVEEEVELRLAQDFDTLTDDEVSSEFLRAALLKNWNRTGIK